MTEKQILKSIKALAAGECANYHGGFCAETDRRCHLINPKYDSIRDGMIDCDYFLECVLPANWELSDLVSYALWYDEAEDDDLPSNMKRCEVWKKRLRVLPPCASRLPTLKRKPASRFLKRMN